MEIWLLGRFRSSDWLIVTALLAVAWLGFAPAAQAQSEPSHVFVAPCSSILGLPCSIIIRVQGSIPATPSGTITVDFGDGTTVQQFPLDSGGLVQTTHIFTALYGGGRFQHDCHLWR
jgi:hypothetical protein